MFYYCNKFNCDLSNWDVSNIINFSSMFYNCESFNIDLSKWDVSNGVIFEFMFAYCKKFNADLSKWDVSNAKNYNGFALKSLLEQYPERIPKKFRKNYL